MIKAKGFSVWRFMNLAAFRGIPLWDVAQEGAGMKLKAPRSSMAVLEACAEKTGCTLEILGWGGLPVFLGRFRKRQAWTAGLFLFAAGLYLLSSFVWMIEVEGNERLSEQEILTACKEMGLHPGAWKRSVDTEAITEGLLQGFSDLSWVSVGIRGTDAKIKLAETIEKAEKIDKQTPADIIAAADGVIVQLTAERGTPLVQAGDVVKKGDILISSELLIGVEGEVQHTDYTAAEGTATARIWQRLTEEMPLVYEELCYTGKEAENHVLLIGEKEWDVLHPDTLMQWEKEVVWKKPLAIGDFALPLQWKKEYWKSYEMLQKERTAEEAKTLLEEILRKKTENFLSPYGTIENIEIRFEEYADCVRAEAELTLTEQIGQKRERGLEHEPALQNEENLKNPESENNSAE